MPVVMISIGIPFQVNDGSGAWGKVRRIVEDCFRNIHPLPATVGFGTKRLVGKVPWSLRIYHIKELMIRRELEKERPSSGPLRVLECSAGPGAAERELGPILATFQEPQRAEKEDERQKGSQSSRLC